MNSFPQYLLDMDGGDDGGASGCLVGIAKELEAHDENSNS